MFSFLLPSFLEDLPHELNFVMLVSRTFIYYLLVRHVPFRLLRGTSTRSI